MPPEAGCAVAEAVPTIVTVAIDHALRFANLSTQLRDDRSLSRHALLSLGSLRRTGGRAHYVGEQCRVGLGADHSQAHTFARLVEVTSDQTSALLPGGWRSAVFMPQPRYPRRQ
jgi:hypothetical protein